MPKDPAEKSSRDVHFCATCQHIQVRPAASPGDPVKFFCARLGYETKPRYKFNCWTPRPAFLPAPPSEAQE